MVLLLPFKKYKLEDFDSVIIPLGSAQRHPSVVAENRRRASARTLVNEAEKGQGKPGSDNGSFDKEKSRRETDSDDAILTLESLRAEVDADVSASGHDSAYDRKSKVVNKAIQDIGMGAYQWELFVLCGFGWFADNLCMCCT